eukprot:RCo034680
MDGLKAPVFLLLADDACGNLDPPQEEGRTFSGCSAESASATECAEMAPFVLTHLSLGHVLRLALVNHTAAADGLCDAVFQWAAVAGLPSPRAEKMPLSPTTGAALARDSVAVPRGALLEFLRQELQRWEMCQDIGLALRIVETRKPLVILLAGPTGCGKSTLAAQLSSRLGISTVLATDSIRLVLQEWLNPEQYPELFASTYTAFERVSENGCYSGLGHSEIVVKAWEAQSEVVVRALDRLIRKHVQRGEPLIIEGVHLSPSFLVQVMQRHDTAIPFLVHISDETAHKLRFSIRLRTVDADSQENNPYLRRFAEIRAISDHLVAEARRHRIPTVDTDAPLSGSLSAMHHTLLACLRRLDAGHSLLDSATLCTTIDPLAEQLPHHFPRDAPLLAAALGT